MHPELPFPCEADFGPFDNTRGYERGLEDLMIYESGERGIPEEGDGEPLAMSFGSVV